MSSINITIKNKLERLSLKGINFGNLKYTVKNLAEKLLKEKILLITKDRANNSSFVSIGSIKPLARYKYLYLGRAAHVRYLLKISFNTRKLLPYLLNKTGLVVIKDSGLVDILREQVVMQPSFIDLEISLPDTFEDYYKTLTGARADVRKIKKNGYTSTISKEPGWVDKFFDHYYVPSMRGRHAEEAYIMPRHEIMALIKQPGAEFLDIFSNGQCVASTLCKADGVKYYYLRVGWLNGDDSLLAAGATAAIYWFLIQRAYELGCKSISLGGTPPYLENGVLKYKAKWQARFCPDVFYVENYLLLDPSNPVCYQFLHDTSLVVFGLKNSLIVLSSKLSTDLSMPGIILNDIESWFLLRPQRSEFYPAGMEDLPEHLRYWYQKIP
ncbi:hypothetical protein ACPPVU_01760 [Mucilaginibacter sp. McL0603]|uniref:hypothetical protein n=1 Tax=Mucilaginibacter sp. McL0603 TaxID=3415670 RepID=UPI003CEFD9FC